MKPNFVQDKEELRRFLEGFVREDRKKYLDLLQKVANRELRLLTIEMDDVHEFFGDDGGLYLRILTNAYRYTDLFASAADTVMPKPTIPLIDDNHQDALTTQRIQKLLVAGGGSVDEVKTTLPAELLRRFELVLALPSKDKPKKLREIRAENIGSLLAVTGIVTRATEVKPLTRIASYLCSVCAYETYQEVKDMEYTPLTVCPSPKCKADKVDGKLYPEARGSRYLKYQELKLQEMPTEVPVGHVPRTILLKVHGELTRLAKPGDLICVSGIYLPDPAKGYRAMRQGLTTNTYIKVTGISQLKANAIDWEEKKDLLEDIETQSQDKDIYERLAASIAPEICGLEDVKKSILLLLMGGTNRQLEDINIRGDLNMLLLGDPGVAKSQLLKYVSRLVPRGVYTTGKGSTGVGLTAAVIRDPVTSEITLEGGALVLADRGVCCIDEFDKMEESDRTAIHEVMEQQTVSITKAGMNTQLNARAAILAAANPIFGRYDIKRSPEANLGLPTSIISRFDLIFILRDVPNEETDDALARHITYVHKTGEAPKKEIGNFDEHFLRAYLTRGKQFMPDIPPDLTDEIVQNYVDLRKESSRGKHYEKDISSKYKNDRQSFVTPRSLLSVLRLSEALARIHFRSKVTREDVLEAIRLTEVARTSIDEDDKKKKAGSKDRDRVGASYDIIIDYMKNRNLNRVRLVDLESLLSRKGYSRADFNRALSLYQGMVWDTTAEYLRLLPGAIGGRA